MKNNQNLELFPDTCIEPPAPRDRDGYSCVRVDKTRIRGHIIAYKLFHGTIPHGNVVMHMCDNPACCNPRHLVIGTQRDNIEDCIRKGRRPQNPQYVPNRRLTTEDVLAIRGREQHVPTRILSKKYNVTYQTIRNIKAGKTWDGAFAPENSHLQTEVSL